MGGVIASHAFYPPPAMMSVEEAVGKGLIWICTSQNHCIPAFYYPGRDHPTCTVLYSHGNAEDITHLYPFLRELALKINVNILSYDYSGYSFSYRIKRKGKTASDTIPAYAPELALRNSSFSPTEGSAFADVEAAQRYLVKVKKVKPETELVYWGKSLGSGPTCHIASKKPGAAVILQSALMSAIRVVKNCWVTLPFDIFANIDKVHRFRCPSYIIHGTHDEVIGVHHGESLFAALKTEKKELWLIPGAGHNDVELRSEFNPRIETFLKILAIQVEEKAKDSSHQPLPATSDTKDNHEDLNHASSSLM